MCKFLQIADECIVNLNEVVAIVLNGDELEILIRQAFLTKGKVSL